MDKLKSVVHESLKLMVADSSPNDLPSTSSSLLKFFSDLPQFHQMIRDLSDPNNALCAKNKDAALVSKQMGNECYLCEDYTTALSCYSQALRLAPIDVDDMGRNLVATLYMNRASLFQKIGLLQECLRDCNRALQISPRYAKAWYRRGKANVSLGNYKDAVNDLNIARDTEVSSGGKRRIESELKELVHKCREMSNKTVAHHENLIFLDEACQMKIKCVTTPDKGRGMVSDCEIPQAFLVHKEEPYAMIISKDYRETHCHYCLNELPGDTVPCASCSIALYCSQRCQERALGQAFCGITKDLGKYKNDSDSVKGIEDYIREITLCSDSKADVEYFPEHKHECRGVNWPTVLPADIVLAARVLVKSTLQGRGYVEDLSHNYLQIPSESKLEVYIFSIVLLYCLQHSDGLELPINGASISQAVIIISQIRVNSMAVVRMKSVDSYGLAGELGKHPSNVGALTSTLEQVRVGQAIYAAASLFNHSCKPNVHAYFLSRTLFIRTTEFVAAGCPLELSYGPQIGQFQCNDRLKILVEKYSFRCQCRSCSAVNISDLVIDAFHCTNLTCPGVVLDGCVLNCENEKLKNFRKLDSGSCLDAHLQVIETKDFDISDVAHCAPDVGKRFLCIDPGYCLKCGCHRDIESSCAASNLAWKYIRSLQDALISREISHTTLADASKSLVKLRSILHAYNKGIAEAEDALAQAFCLLGDLQSANEHCKASIKILEVLYGSQHIVIGYELVKLVSIQLSVNDYSTLDSINRLRAIFSLYYGLHADIMFPYLQSLKRDACKLLQ
ncbi:SET and MYND domain-containing protein 4 isoform X2 [Tripterygium wilfordii]|nr:SET and MYND domain-containing protein 4 isoform X2 [Tripterygium wilfordii]XP_038694880.1 SET and MYND domain-containing protein 4 isoform X2 [Tripterygium wilfordii]XP_038694881.1 SET and MYND domain-containing protein 4 isoform X2 [Tripterygium wilfordii]